MQGGAAETRQCNTAVTHSNATVSVSAAGDATVKPAGAAGRPTTMYLWESDGSLQPLALLVRTRNAQRPLLGTVTVLMLPVVTLRTSCQVL